MSNGLIDWLRRSPSVDRAAVCLCRSHAMRLLVKRKCTEDAKHAGRIYNEVRLGELIAGWSTPDLF